MPNTCKKAEGKSRYTGYNRDSWEMWFKKLCFGAIKYRSTGKARISFPSFNSVYGEDYDSFSTMARMLPMMAYYLCNPQNPQVISLEGKMINVRQFVLDAFRAGTDQNSEDYWGKIQDRTSKIVEVNDIIWTVWLLKDTLIKEFTISEMDRIIEFVDQVYDKVVWENNWMFTPLLVHILKLDLGYHDDFDCEPFLKKIDRMYRGNGWYSDLVESDTFDYYNAWQINFCTLILAYIGRNVISQERADRYIQNAKEFLKSFPFFFASNGNYIPFGRSVAYRFAVLGTMLLAEYMGISPLVPGLERRIASGNLQFFMENGSLNDKGYLNCGYLGEPTEKYEIYMFYGSPYWCSRGFICLALPKEHPFWNDDEVMLPVEQGNFSYRIDKIGFTLIGNKETGSVQLFNSKNSAKLIKRSEPFYAKFCYSTHFYLDYVRTRKGFPPDSMLYCASSDGTALRMLKICEAENGVDYIKRTMLQGIDRKKVLAEIKSIIIQSGIFQIRFHRITPLEGSLLAHEGTYSLSFDNGSLPYEEHGNDWAFATSGQKTIYMKALFGYDKVVSCCGWGEKNDVNLLPGSSIILTAETSWCFETPLYCGTISIGEPCGIKVEKIATSCPCVTFNENDQAVVVGYVDGNKKSYKF